MNAALRDALGNPWLASLVSFLPIVAFLGVLWLCLPRPLPTIEGIGSMPWWAPLGGLIGDGTVVAGRHGRHDDQGDHGFFGSAAGRPSSVTVISF
jgi:uncharacterized membrane protein YdcZ (DUF606 family)